MDGHGIGRYEGLTVFVPGALPGETVKASVIKLTKNYAVAGYFKLLSVRLQEQIRLALIINGAAVVIYSIYRMKNSLSTKRSM